MSFEGFVMKNKKVRGFGFYDYENDGYGYIYPLNDIKNEELQLEEYQVQGKCICCYEQEENDECENDDECGMGKKCYKDEGKCINISNNWSCVNNYDCMGDEICNSNGECILFAYEAGCREDDDCKYGEMCKNHECVSVNTVRLWCVNNFDCNDYDHVCVNNECVYIDDKTETCLNENDCSIGYFCNYEYLVCIKERKEMLNRRNKEVVPAICSVYGVVSLFVIASSYTVSQYLGKDKLIDKCDEQCSNLFYKAVGTIIEENFEVTKLGVKEVQRRKDSMCTGNCRPNKRIKAKEGVELTKVCETLQYTKIVSTEEKLSYQDEHKFTYVSSPSHNVFVAHLSAYCKSYTEEYWYHYTKPTGKYSTWRKSIICVGNPSSIKCQPQ